MNKNRRWVIIVSLTFVVVLCWAVTSAMSRMRQSTIPKDIEKIMDPLNPQVDEQLFVKLSGRAK